MKKLFLGLVLSVICITGTAGEKVLVANQTYIVETPSAFRVETSNKEMAKEILNRLSLHFNKVNITEKKDRHGEYWHYSFTFKASSWNTVISFFKDLNN